MIAFINGEIISKRDNTVIIECNGIGYEVIVSTNTLITLAGEGEIGKILTYMQVREDGITLFGFATEEEKMMFNLLISVSGIGAKMAISILSASRISDLAIAISSENIKALSAIKGLGKKTAERLIVELKDKVSPLGFMTQNDAIEFVNSDAVDEAMLVLMSLGLTKSESLHLAKLHAKDSNNAEEIIQKALKNMGANK